MITITLGLANSLSLTSTVFHSKNTNAAAKSPQSQIGLGKLLQGEQQAKDGGASDGEADR